MLHVVDYRDHFFKYPLHFLQFSQNTWRRFLNPGRLATLATCRSRDSTWTGWIQRPGCSQRGQSRESSHEYGPTSRMISMRMIPALACFTRCCFVYPTKDPNPTQTP